MINSVIACLFLFVFGAVLFVVNATAPSRFLLPVRRPARILPGGRPCWRPSAGKTLSHHRATPTVRPESRPATDHVGAAPPAKPHLTTEPRQQAGPNPARRPTMLAPPCRQSLIPPPSHANRPAQNLLAGRPCWRLAAVKTLSHRRATPTGHLESCPAAAHVCASPPSKPYPTVGPRQQAGPNPACRPSMLAPLRRQSLIPPPSHANRPPPASSRDLFYTEIYKPTIIVYILTVMV